MNQEVKTKWVEALRSGNYKQGTGRLRRNDNFCCLGVLCDVVEPASWSESDLNIDRSVQLLHRGRHASPHECLMDELELNEADVDNLVDLNDERNWGFDQIADWIEENV